MKIEVTIAMQVHQSGSSSHGHSIKPMPSHVTKPKVQA